MISIWTILMENGKPQLLLEHKQMYLRPTMKQKKEHLHAHIVLK